MKYCWGVSDLTIFSISQCILNVIVMQSDIPIVNVISMNMPYRSNHNHTCHTNMHDSNYLFKGDLRKTNKMAARREAKILQVFSVRLIKAIDAATGSTPAMFSAYLVAKELTPMRGASNIVQVASNPPYTTISQLVTNACTRIQGAATDQEAKRLRAFPRHPS